MARQRRSEVYALLDDFEFVLAEQDRFVGQNRFMEDEEQELLEGVVAYERLLLREADQLESQPKSYRLFAFNQPGDSVVRLDSVLLEQSGCGPKRPWLRLLNPPDRDPYAALIWSRRCESEVWAVAWFRIAAGGSGDHSEWSRKRELIAAGLGDGRILIREARTSEPICTLTWSSYCVTCIAWSLDGRWTVLGCTCGTILLWDTENGQQLRLLKTGSYIVGCVAWSPDGRRIVSGTADGTFQLWDAESGEILHELFHQGRTHYPDDGSGPTCCVAWSLDGRRIVSGRDDGTLRVWDAEAGTEVRRITLHLPPISCVEWSPDGRWIVAVGHGLSVWDAESGLQVWAAVSGVNLGINYIPSWFATVTSVAWAPNGRQIVSGSCDGMLRVWGAESGVCELELPGHFKSVTSVAWSPDGRRIVSGSEDKTLQVWNTDSNTALSVLIGDSTPVTSVVWSPNGRQIASGHNDGKLQVWNGVSGTCEVELAGHSRSVTSMAWSPDGRQIVSASEDDTLQVWDAENGAELDRFRGHRVSNLAWFPSDRRIVPGDGDRALRVWANRGSKRRTLSWQSWPVQQVGGLPDAWIASGTDDRTLRMWAAESGVRLRLRLKSFSWPEPSVAWSADGRRIVLGSRQFVHGQESYTLQVWDAESGVKLRTFMGHSHPVACVAWSPDGGQIVSGSEDQTLRVWDAESGAEVCMLTGHSGIVTSVAWSLDNRWIVSGSEDRTLRVWDTENGEELHRWTSNAPIKAVAVAPGLSNFAILKIAVGTANGDVRLLQLEEKQEWHSSTKRVSRRKQES